MMYSRKAEMVDEEGPASIVPSEVWRRERKNGILLSFQVRFSALLWSSASSSSRIRSKLSQIPPRTHKMQRDDDRTNRKLGRKRNSRLEKRFTSRMPQEPKDSWAQQAAFCGTALGSSYLETTGPLPLLRPLCQVVDCYFSPGTSAEWENDID